MICYSYPLVMASFVLAMLAAFWVGLYARDPL